MTENSSTTNGQQQQQPQPQSSSSNSGNNANNVGQHQISSQSASASSTSSSSSANIKRQSQAGIISRNQPIMIGSSSPAFQQVKQTQSSLARLTRVHQLLQQQQEQHHQQQQNSQINQSSQQSKSEAAQQTSHQPTKSTSSFVDCLIRRFKDCFSEDFCTVPVFVVGNLSPGSDGTHLILPPCVSLGRQNISRFANPRNNLRHMNSIRESCKSIEELDLGSNKLSDLIEVYKILQCTPNLKFLNLSENDLSKTSPVAMACCPTYIQTTLSSSSSSSSYTGGHISSSASNHHAQWQPTAANQQLQQRTCLAPINQNHTMRTTPVRPHSSMSTRRHSTLGQSSVGGVASGSRQNLGRVNEARRLTAATAALAQSKKTSSSVASKLAHSVTGSNSALASSRQLASSRRSAAAAVAVVANSVATRSSPGKSVDNFCARVPRAGTTSTMNLARSLSSLSAKDVKASNLLSSRRIATRRTTQATRVTGLTSVNDGSTIVNSHSSGQLIMAAGQLEKTEASQSDLPTNELPQQEQEKQQQTSRQESELFSSIGAPIVETDADVDMNEPVVPVQTSLAAATTINNNNATRQSINGVNNDSPHHGHHQLAATSRAPLLSYQQQQHHQHQMSGMKGSTGQMASSSSSNFRRTFRSIKALALNNTGCPWRVVCSILSRMPNLEELHLSLNNYERIDLDPNEFKHPTLKRLYLCNNPKLTSWQELDKLLYAFPSLEALSIADCNISQIPDNLDRASEWHKICGLNINGWPIKEWPIIERLNQLPSLIDLKCRNLEVLQSIDEPRHHLIARLPKLQRLNGSEIEEREHAEKTFLRFFMANSHLERPSRFHELIQIHGEVTTTVDVDVDLSPPSQASVRIIHLNRNFYRKEDQDEVLMSEDFLVKLMDNVEPYSNNSQQQQTHSLENMDDCDNEHHQSSSSAGGSGQQQHQQPVRLFKDEGQEVVALDVDLRQSVRKFKSTLSGLFGLDQQNIILYYIDHEMVGLMGPELIKHNQKKLWNYNVQNGDQFIVEER